MLIDQGAASLPFFVILEGEIEAVLPFDLGAIFRIQVSKPGEFIELDRRQMMALVQNDAEIGEIVLQAFIMRRLGFLNAGVGDVVLIGSTHAADTLRIKEFLMRNSHPYTYVDLERDAEVEQLMTAFDVKANEVPVVICRGKTVLRNPSNRELAQCLGFNESVDRKHIRDLVVIGAGPAGLAAAVYGASEGLDVLVVETNAPGGQAGSSSRIENYLGFPMGVSGQELAGRAFTQAEKFGAEILIDKAVRLHCENQPYRVRLESEEDVPARAIVIAGGAQYRRPPLENLDRFENLGIYYGATFIEANLCTGDDVVVVGGGNSAGQAAVFLSKSAKRVYVLVRGAGLAESMSRYLSRRIQETPNIELKTCTEIVALEGKGRLEHVAWRNNETGSTEEHAIEHV